MDVTCARVDLEIANNATWEDAFQFGDSTDTTWSFTNQSFRLDIKGTDADVTFLLSCTTANGRIVVDSVTLRVLHLFVADTTIQGALLPTPKGEKGYVYDLIMIDNSTGVRVRLMRGHLKVIQGITGD